MRFPYLEHFNCKAKYSFETPGRHIISDAKSVPRRPEIPKLVKRVVSVRADGFYWLRIGSLLDLYSTETLSLQSLGVQRIERERERERERDQGLKRSEDE